MGKGLVLLAGLLAGGCAGWGGEQSATGDRIENDDIAASVEASVRGESVRLMLHVTNTGDETMAFRFGSSQRYDFAVEDASGETVWRWSEGMAFAQAISEAELAPGETWDFEAEWTPGDREGRHRASGWITATERDVRQSTTFELP